MKPADERLNALMLAAQQMAAKQRTLMLQGKLVVKPRNPKEEAEAPKEEVEASADAETGDEPKAAKAKKTTKKKK